MLTTDTNEIAGPNCICWVRHKIISIGAVSKSQHDPHCPEFRLKEAPSPEPQKSKGSHDKGQVAI